MITTQEWIEPTRAAGLAAYGAATVCCAVAWSQMKARRQNGRLAAVLLLIEGALLVDMALNLRWRLHQALMDLAIAEHVYDERGGPQMIALLVFGCLLLIAGVMAFRSFRGRWAALMAVLGATFSIVLWCAEVVSLHAVDHVLYQEVAGLKSVSVLWVLSCMMTAVGITIAAMPGKPPLRHGKR